MRLRAPRRDEARAVLDVIVAADVASIGRPDYTLQDVLDDWALPRLELDADVFVVGFVAQLALAPAPTVAGTAAPCCWRCSTRLAPPGWTAQSSPWPARTRRPRGSTSRPG